MGTPHQTAQCPACGTRAIVDPRTKKVRAHLRKGGVTCDGKVERPSRLARFVPPFVRRPFVRRRRMPDGVAGVDAAAGVDPAALPNAASPATAGDDSAGPVRIRVDCPVCGRFCAVDPEEIRIRLHRNRSEKKCPGSGTFPEVEALTFDGISVAEVRQRRKDSMAKRKPAGRA